MKTPLTMEKIIHIWVTVQVTVSNIAIEVGNETP